MSKSLWVIFLLIGLPLRAQVLTGQPGSVASKSFNISAQILDEGSFQLQRTATINSNWSVVTNFNSLPGTNTFSDAITNLQRFYRINRLTIGPAITNHPVGVTNFYNQTVRLEATATGSWPLRYFWFRDGQFVPGANSNVLTFAGRTNLNGNYAVAVSNQWGAATSPQVAVKTINPAPASIAGKKIEYVIKGRTAGTFRNNFTTGTFETTYNATPNSYNTTSSNFNLNDSGQWQYTATGPATGRVLWSQGAFVYYNGAILDMTFTNLTSGTYELAENGYTAKQLGEFRITN